MMSTNPFSWVVKRDFFKVSMYFTALLISAVLFVKKEKENKMIITSEQVGRGHPDKVADQVSDAILTECLRQDEDSRVAVETAIGKGIIFLTGEITSNAKLNINSIVKKTLNSIDVEYRDFKVIENISPQSPEINAKVDKEEIGAGDQGLMYGYATNETINFLPIPFVLASKIIKEYENKFASKDGDYKYDSKSQVSYDYKNKKIININLSVQHSKNKNLETLRKEIKTLILDTVKNFEIENNILILNDDTDIIINNAGTFIMGGAIADSGLTGRKIIADTYGGWGRHGGGAFSGKDYTKVDRSAAYYSRYVAKKVVESGMADIIEIQVSYIIGQTKPVAINFETFETNKKTLQEIELFVNSFDFSLANIIKELDLKKIDYTKTTVGGHFGKSNLIWG